MPRLSAIFFDLDQTLIHTRSRHEPADGDMATATAFGPYAAWLRPTAHQLLATARAIKCPVFLCTMAERRYAHGLSQLFNLGFDIPDILGIEHLRLGHDGVSPNSILIDDLPPTHEFPTFKRKVLGITPEQQFQIPPFRGKIEPDEARVPDDFLNYLRRWREAR